MKSSNSFLSLAVIIFALAFSSSANAEYYMEVAPGEFEIDTSTAKATRPLFADFRFGHETGERQLELALMLGINEDRLNELEVDVPFAFSAFYRYRPEIHSSIKLDLVLGVSHVEVESSYAGIADGTDRFSGVSFGIGFEESFEFNPKFKMTFDWVRLYQSDDLTISSTSLGLHYEF